MDQNDKKALIENGISERGEIFSGPSLHCLIYYRAKHEPCLFMVYGHKQLRVEVVTGTHQPGGLVDLIVDFITGFGEKSRKIRGGIKNYHPSLNGAGSSAIGIYEITGA